MIVVRNTDPSAPVVTQSSLSFKAMGLLIFILTHPASWSLTLDNLCDAKTDDKDSVLEGLSELYQADYLLFFRWQTKGGNWIEEYLVFETPELRDRYLKILPEDRKQYIKDPASKWGTV